MQQRFLLSCAAFCAVSWLLAQGSRPYYLFHILPLLAIAGAIAVALLFAAVLWGDSVAFGQDQSAATSKDVNFARKILMNSIG